MFVLRLRAPTVASPVRFAAPFASLLFAPLAGAAGARGAPASCVRASSSSILPRRSPAAVPSSAPAIISGAGPSSPVPPRLPLLRFGASIRWRSAHAPASQVHLATTLPGEAVVVKVLYPEIRQFMAADLSNLKQAAKIESGSKTPGLAKAGKVTKSQLREIAEKKMVDLNANDVEAAMMMIAGSARSMGLDVVEG
jgi:hypothetical protein